MNFFTLFIKPIIILKKSVILIAFSRYHNVYLVIFAKLRFRDHSPQFTYSKFSYHEFLHRQDFILSASEPICLCSKV